MDDLRVPLSDFQQAFLDAEIAEGEYADAAAYVASLIDEKAKAKAQQKLEALLLEGLEGEAREWTKADWDALRRRARGF